MAIVSTGSVGLDILVDSVKRRKAPAGGGRAAAGAAGQLPAAHDWRTTDADETEKRRQRARDEAFVITLADPFHPIYTNFKVRSGSGLTYTVEIRGIADRQFACECVDFRINGLGTCKHIEAVLFHLDARLRRRFRTAAREPSPRVDIVLDRAANALKCQAVGAVPRPVRRWLTADGRVPGDQVEEAVAALRSLSADGYPQVRVSQEVSAWIERRRILEERRRLRHEYELNVQSGAWPAQETRVPLFPYQREGMLHLAFAERALLADEMGLGKTIQAIAACALLHRLGKAQRVLVVTPASLKTEWEEQIQRFTGLPYRLVFGSRARRLELYGDAAFFTIANYEQMLGDALDVNHRLAPDIVVLDEAQRIKNWSTKTAQAVKRLRSRYAFVLTGTPIENRIDDLHSLMDFLDPAVLGPLFRFNREFYVLDDRGRPCGYQNLDRLHERIQPYLLRRRKAEVETELPARTDRNHFVKLSPGQRVEYGGHEAQVSRLVQAAKRRPLTQQEQDKLMRELAMMRMVCDTNYILDPQDRECPKLAEIEKLLEECAENETKVIVFSEWERMLELVRELCGRLGFGFAWHTGRVPQLRRRAEINLFKNDSDCRVFLTTDSGAAGLNLQVASVVINCDLPWNPAKLEQRIARAWRKNQTRPVTVINLVSEDTIEHRMLDTLANKQALADGVLDLQGDLANIPMRGGRAAFLARLQQLVSVTPTPPTPPLAPSPTDRGAAFAAQVSERLGPALVRCEERYPSQGAHSVLVVVVNQDAASWRPQVNTLHAALFGPGQTDPLAPVQVEVIDQATHDAIERLVAAGLVQKAARSTRPLWPEADAAAQALSAEEQARLGTQLAAATRKLKLTCMLGDGGFVEEAAAAARECLFAVGRVLALESRLPEPGSLDEALQPPLSAFWGGMLDAARAFAADTAAWSAAAQATKRWLDARTARA